MLNKTDAHKKRASKVPEGGWGPHLWEKTYRMIQKAVAEGTHTKMDVLKSEAGLPRITCADCKQDKVGYHIVSAGGVSTRQEICKGCFQKRERSAAAILKIIRRK